MRARFKQFVERHNVRAGQLTPKQLEACETLLVHSCVGPELLRVATYDNRAWPNQECFG